MKKITDKFDTAKSVCDYIKDLNRLDEKRQKVRAKVEGIIDGNPPYSHAELKRENMLHVANVNFREAESYMAMAQSSYYDLLTEAPTLATIRPKNAKPLYVTPWGNSISEHFDTMLKDSDMWDSTCQLSQRGTVGIGYGVLFWCDNVEVIPEAAEYGAVLIDDRAKSDVSKWCSIGIKYPMSAGELNRKIIDEGAAKDTGWNLAAVRNSIMKAGDGKNLPNEWEYFQNQLRNNETGFSSNLKVINTCFFFYKEDDGTITQCVVDLDNPEDYLMRRESYYKSWKNCVAAMYYDKGKGTHHSVKGLGIKMCNIMELKNRLLCSMVDAGFDATRNMIKVEGADAAAKFATVHKGSNTLLPPGAEFVQRNMSGAIEAPVLVNRQLDGILTNNLSQYRQNLEKPQGNPRTAFEVSAILSQQSTIGKTQLNRYYQQLDDVYTEIFRRAVQATDGIGKEFKDAVKKDGIPESALNNCRVKATRVAGQGSQFLRNQSIQQILGISNSLPEAGRVALIEDYIASLMGQSMVRRYMPQEGQTPNEAREYAWATLELGTIKDGIMPIVTNDQNHMLHATIHIRSAAEAFKSIKEKGANAADVAMFMDLSMQHVEQHLQLLSQDPLRQGDAQAISIQLEDLKPMAQEAMKAAGEQSTKPPSTPSDDEQMRKQVEFENDQARRDQAAAAELDRKEAAHRQKLAMKDADHAVALRNKAMQNKAQIDMAKEREAKKPAPKKPAQ